MEAQLYSYPGPALAMGLASFMAGYCVILTMSCDYHVILMVSHGIFVMLPQVVMPLLASVLKIVEMLLTLTWPCRITSSECV